MDVIELTIREWCHLNLHVSSFRLNLVAYTSLGFSIGILVYIACWYV